MNIQAVLDAQRALKRKPEDLLIICNKAFLEEATREFNLQWYASTPPRLAGMEIKRDDTIESFVVLVKDQPVTKPAETESPRGSMFNTERILLDKIKIQMEGSTEDQIQVRMTPAFFEKIAKENNIDPASSEPPRVTNLLILIDPSLKQEYRMIDLRPRYSKHDLARRVVKSA